MAKAIPVRGAKFRKACSGNSAGFLLLIQRVCLENDFLSCGFGRESVLKPPLSPLPISESVVQRLSIPSLSLLILPAHPDNNRIIALSEKLNGSLLLSLYDDFIYSWTYFANHSCFPFHQVVALTRNRCAN